MMPANLPVLTIDGDRVDDLASFTREFSAFLDDYTWQGGLDAFNDILRGGFGTPAAGFVLRWVNSDRSRRTLGWDATIRWYEENLKVCHPDNREDVRARLDRARRHEGTTLFDWIVDIIRIHGPGGRESVDQVHLDLQ